MRPSYDVLIIGGGVIGSSIAYHLTGNPDFTGRVAVIERDPGYAGASSSLSTSAIRQQFSTPPNIRMSAYSIAFLRDARTRLSVDGDPAEIGLREPGYLILGGPDQAAAFEANNAAQRACGIQTELLDPAELRRRHPWLNTEGVAIGAYGPDGEGWFDGPGLLQAFKRKARAQGTTYIASAVTGFEHAEPGRLGGVTLATGERLSASTVVVAAGAWSGVVARLAGVALPVAPRKRCVFVIESPANIPHAPFVFDTSGVFVRPEGALYLCGAAPLVENAPDDFGMEIDHALFDDVIWPALANRIPGFERLRLRRAWAGLYDDNGFDHSAIIGRHPAVANLVFACGFSGHGMMHAPAAGAGTAELILYGAARSVELQPFGYERIAAGEPIREHVY